MKKRELNELVVMNHLTDATVFRIVAIEGRYLGLIDASIDGQQNIHWMPIGSELDLTVFQRKQFTNSQ